MKKHWWHKSKKHTAFFSFAVAAVIVIIGFGVLYIGSRFIPENAIVGGVDLPVRLIIPKISVNAAVQSVGITANGEMGIPSNFTDVAWYNLGPKPGERGSAAMSGHLDTASATDVDAVFIHLNELKAGDEIDVVDKSGHTIKFRVTQMQIYDTTKAPLGKIFDQSVSTADLNLITCDGIWNQSTKDYSKRLVVYSKRIQ